eukprot:6493929-Alexandrium_andersonii.AAC.1
MRRLPRSRRVRFTGPRPRWKRLGARGLAARQACCLLCPPGLALSLAGLAPATRRGLARWSRPESATYREPA